MLLALDSGIPGFLTTQRSIYSKGHKHALACSTRKAQGWFVELRRKLRHGERDAVIKDVEQALTVKGLPSNARQTLTNLHAYLVRHQEHLDYKRMKQSDLPIGSGMVESA